MEPALALERDGYAIVPGVLQPETVDALIERLDAMQAGAGVRAREGETYGLRNLLRAVPSVHALAESPLLRALVEPVLGPGAFVVRGLLFDKPAGANWKVPWHQDLTIPVRERVDVPGFGPWSVKASVPYVQPPVSVLEKMLALRLHLDDCGAENGPLKVLPGSHTCGRLDADGIRRWRDHACPVTCLLPRGGVLVMRPLLLHASSPALRPGHRRVIHLEYASELLPGGLQWEAA